MPEAKITSFSGLSGGSEIEAPDESGWTVQCGNILGGASLEGARSKRGTKVDGRRCVEIAWGELRWRERDRSVGRRQMDGEAWK